MKAVIEIPKGSIFKYEIKNDELLLDRVNSMVCPIAYGYLDGTLGPDNDPLDLFLIEPNDQSLFPGTRVEVELIGGFEVLDNGISDNKMLGLIKGHTYNKTTFEITTIVKQIEFYLTNYKPNSKVLRFVHNKEEVAKMVNSCLLEKTNENL